MSRKHPRALRTAPASLLLVLALGLTGCSSGSEPGGDEQPAPPVAADGGSYASTEELRAALNDAGLPCDEPLEGEYEGVSQAQGCILDGSEDVLLLRFADDDEQAGYLADRDDLASVVLGEDWAVQTVLPETAERVAGALGGEVVPPLGS